MPGLLVALATLVGCAGNDDSGSPERVELADNWQYRWGDSPTTESGLPLWLLDSPDSPEWLDIDVPLDAPGRGDSQYLWLRVPLPTHAWEDPGVYLTSVLGAFEAYADTESVYEFGHMSEPRVHGYDAGQWHMFGLPKASAGGMLSIRLFSAFPDIGVPLMADNKALCGSETALLRYIVVNSIDRFVLGSFFFLLGVMAFDFHHHRRRRHEHHYIAFALFSASTGLAFGPSAEVAQFVVSSPIIRFGISQLGLFYFPVGLFCFCEHIARHGEERIFRRLWQLYAAGVTLLLLLQFSGLVTQFALIFVAWGLMVGLAFLVGIGLSIRGAARGNEEAKIFYLGLIATLGFVIHDLLWGYGIIPYWHYLSPWGVLVFLVALVHIVERRNAADQKQLAEYSLQLQEHADELEQRVEDRTRDLQEKNVALEQTMGELRETQSQLVMREKMAALGNLVAGIAHEINNPVGAIRSAADVMRRAVARLGQAGARQTDDGLTLKVLASNSAVVDEASERVSRIVRSLKDFAELDEAAYQQGMDVSQMLDNVLVLMEHSLGQGITVSRQYEPVPLIACYAGELKQALMNVLVNAVEATGGEGTIALGVSRHDETVVIQIADSGRGIPAPDITRIFDPGFTTKGTGVGTGLGLSTSYRTVQRHGGRIKAESDGRTGTTITISLPLAGPQDAPS